jgi:malto-oligosyltrehalose trehalohydrolase/4-alpha-glucanotransferase
MANSAAGQPLIQFDALSDDILDTLQGDALAALEKDILPRYLLERRWYGAKDAGIPAVKIIDAVPFDTDGNSVLIATLRVEPPGQSAQLYLLPLTVHWNEMAGQSPDAAWIVARIRHAATEGVLLDAFSQDDFVRALLGAIDTADAADTRGFRFRHTDAYRRHRGVPDAPIRRSQVEQSNTSLRIGDAVIMKAFRKLEEGIHPELEMGRFLTETAGFAHVPALLGSVERVGPSGATTTLCVVQTLVPNQGDGWSHVLGRLEERINLADPKQPLADDAMLDFARRLGRRTGELHRALATPTDDDAFRPEPATPAVLGEWADGVRVMARSVLRGLEQARARLEPTLQAEADRLLNNRDGLMARIDRLVPDGVEAARMRLHGDYHLGQVLVSDDGDVYIIDFEGEPMRPLAERRGRHSPLRDVAGMLRSFAYASASAAGNLQDDMRAAESRRLADWTRDVSAAFLQSYRTAVAGCPGIPKNQAHAAQLMRLFLLEKALYEIGYELANRPDWVGIPLAGVLSILDETGDETGSEPVIRAHAMPFGAEVQPDGTVRFRLWAPMHKQISLAIQNGGETLSMMPAEDGWHELTTDRAKAGSRYLFELPDGLRVPDPGSRYQPEDVHGPSEVIDPGAYPWTDDDWKGRPWTEAVLYELHVGTFTPDGTYLAVIDKLDHLVDLGVTAIELLPVSDFPGKRNWGYDGVLPYAPDGAYGRPEDLKALVDAAHAKGLMVFMDVVYNHFGPDGNYLNAYAKSFFTERHHTPWGAAINYDGPDSGPVRDFMIHNALYWIEEFHLDGLRLDAVHAIIDDSPKHLLEELAERVHALKGPDRHVHLVLENDANQARFLARGADGKPQWYDAQWNDDLHHALHVAASGETGGYYADYADVANKLGRSLAEGFAFQGDPSAYRDGEVRGEPSAHLPPTAFVTFIQNHDQIGNRAFGDRITAFSPAEAVRAVASLYLLSPAPPMLFMGEEWASAQPFPFFCDFGPELAEAVRKGRSEEFAKFPEFQNPEARERIPDATDEQTFLSAKLDWDNIGKAPHADWLAWYRRALSVRCAEVVPRLAGLPGGTGQHDVLGEKLLRVSWQLGDGSRLAVLANLFDRDTTAAGKVDGRVIWTEGQVGAADGRLGPWAVVWTIDESGGGKRSRGATEDTGTNQTQTADSTAAGSEQRVPGQEATALDRLAAQVGIEAAYDNAAGDTVRTSPAIQCNLLAAMGMEVRNEGDAEARLIELDLAELAKPLPPVAVVREDRLPLEVKLTLPVGGNPLNWTLEQENGEVRLGTAKFSDLPLLRTARVGGHPVECRLLRIDVPMSTGYHRLRVDCPGEQPCAMPVIVTPKRCWLPEGLADGRKIWGLSAQLYLLRSKGDWGIGDFGTLKQLVEIAADLGAAVVGLNPLHTMFLDNPEHASPYSPATRLFLNALYIDVTRVPEFATCERCRMLVEAPGFKQKLAAAREAPLVDYDAVLQLKLPVLDVLFQQFQERAEPQRREAFAAFRREQGEVLERLCRFQALREHFAAQGEGMADWRRWPSEYRDAGSPAVARFAEQHRDRIAFLAWIQWVADRQLADAAAVARARGMAVGLYRDLAVGADASGAETWSDPRLVVAKAHVGAPPDLYNPAGQDWGLPPLNPQALRNEAYRGFIELVRANMRHAGGLRIDHAMALQHVYWIPEGQSPAEGAYVSYPFDDMVGILALESQRHRCLVVGEDLGTVPEGFRERMTEAGILSYRVLFFEYDEKGGFVAPDAYPPLALATVGSHDLATLRGWWDEGDIDLKQRHGLYPGAQETAKQQALRVRDKTALVEALKTAGIELPSGFDAEAPYGDELFQGVHRFLAETRSGLAVVQLDDLTEEPEQVNLPATTDQHPNWRRKLSVSLEELPKDRRVLAIAGLFRETRPLPVAEGAVHGV